MKIHLTRAVAFAPIYQYLGENGAAVARDLETVRISPEAVSSPEALVPLEHCARFLEQTSMQYGIEDLGLRAGSNASIGSFGLFGEVLNSALTLKDLIHRFIKLVPLVDSGAKAWLEKASGSRSVRFWIDHEVGVSRASANEYGLMLLIDAMRLALGPEWRPKVVWMPRRRSNVLGRYEALSQAALRFHPCAGVEFPTTFLSTPVLARRTTRKTRTEAEKKLKTSAPPSNTVDLIKQVVRSGIGHTLLSLEELAEISGVSARGIQRRLKQTGTTYREVVDQIRFEESVRMLEDDSKSVTEIALRLGYGEISNFSHAFVRWTGVSPSDYRQDILSEGAATAE